MRASSDVTRSPLPCVCWCGSPADLRVLLLDTCPMSPFDASSLVACHFVTPGPGLAVFPFPPLHTAYSDGGLLDHADSNAGQGQPRPGYLTPHSRLRPMARPRKVRTLLTQSLVSPLIDFGPAWLVPSDLSALPFSRRRSFTRRLP